MCNFVAVQYNDIITHYNMIHNKKLWAIRATQGNESRITSCSEQAPIIITCYYTKQAAEDVLKIYKKYNKFIKFEVVEFTENDN